MCTVFVGVGVAVTEAGFKLDYAASVVKEIFIPKLARFSPHTRSSFRMSNVVFLYLTLTWNFFS